MSNALGPQAVLDTSRLNQLADSIGNEKMAMVFDLILDTTPWTRDELRSACAERDWKRAASAAHKLKSDCVNLGAITLATKLTDFEIMAKTGRPDDAQEIAPELLGLLDQFIEEIRKLRERAHS